MRIAFFWTGVTAPLAACWRALAASPGVQVKVFVEVDRRSDAPVDVAEVLSGLDYGALFSDEPLDREALRASIAAFAPDIMVVIGWRSPMCRFAAECPEFASIKKIFAFDMPWQWTLRKFVAPLFLWRYVRRFSAAFVPGERSATYARWLGFRRSQIVTGLISVDLASYAEAARQRQVSGAYPRQFLYVGRYAPEKRIDVLVEAYARYRSRVHNPWGLICCGTGPDAALLAGREGVTDKGFVQPRDLPGVYAQAGAFVIASDYEPWGMVLAEAAASGLPIICTEACGAHLELVRPGRNGLVCKTGRVESLVSALLWMHDHESELSRMGSQSERIVEEFSTANWVRRLQAIVDQIA